MNWPDVERNLRILYPDHDAGQLMTQLRDALEEHAGKWCAGAAVPDKGRFDESHAALIAYANSIAEDGRPTLATLREFLEEFTLADCTRVVHLLPFYPWDTDRGFSVVDYRRIAEGYGTWEDIGRLAKETELMFDFVANHASIDNPLIQSALIERHLGEDDPRRDRHARFKDFCLAYSPDEMPTEEQLQRLARPRPWPVLAPYVVFERDGELRAALGQAGEFADGAAVLGTGRVWATFSRPPDPDGSEATRQVDLNFANPEVLVEVIRILLFYRRMGATLIRLDAIGYLWKKLGSISLHERETHLILEIIHDLLAGATPEVVTIAEVNEPQENAFTYLGAADRPEADWVYQFTHFPLALHCLLKEDLREYARWLRTTHLADGRQFITTLGTHDGIGMKPIRGILPEEEIDLLIGYLVDHCGGLPNHASLPGGRQIVYEVCTTPWCAVNGTGEDGNEAEFRAKLDRYLAVICLSFLVRGLPAIYINGLLGCSRYLPAEGLDENRTVNREVLNKEELFATLNDPAHRQARVFGAVRELLRQRSSHDAFSQNAPATVVLETSCQAALAAWLPSPSGRDLLQLVNFGRSPRGLTIELPEAVGGLIHIRGDLQHWKLLDGNRLRCEIPPFGTAWWRV